MLSNIKENWGAFSPCIKKVEHDMDPLGHNELQWLNDAALAREIPPLPVEATPRPRESDRSGGPMIPSEFVSWYGPAIPGECAPSGPHGFRRERKPLPVWNEQVILEHAAATLRNALSPAALPLASTFASSDAPGTPTKKPEVQNSATEYATGWTLVTVNPRPSASATFDIESLRNQFVHRHSPRQTLLHDPCAFPCASEANQNPGVLSPFSCNMSCSGWRSNNIYIWHPGNHPGEYHCYDPHPQIGGLGMSSPCPPAKNYERKPMRYCKAYPNRTQSVLERQRYQSFARTLVAIGAQHFGAPTPSARICKMEFHPGYVFITDTDCNEQRLRYTTLEAHLAEVQAADAFTMSSFVSNHIHIVEMSGWTAFLKPCKSFDLDGFVTVALVKKLFPRLPETLKKLIFLPRDNQIPMAVIDAFDLIPFFVKELVFDARLFKDGDLGILVGMMPISEKYSFERLILFGRRFPCAATLNDFFNRIFLHTAPGAAVTLFTTIAPRDDVLAPLQNLQFRRAYTHRRPFGECYDMYYHVAALGRRCLVGFLVPFEKPLISEDDF